MKPYPLRKRRVRPERQGPSLGKQRTKEETGGSPILRETGPEGVSARKKTYPHEQRDIQKETTRSPPTKKNGPRLQKNIIGAGRPMVTNKTPGVDEGRVAGGKNGPQ